MDALYSKLYDSYSKIKTKKFTELDQQNKDQEDKFLNYIKVAEELIQHVNSENDQLQSQLNDMRNEVVSLRSTNDEQRAEYEKLLAEENRKNKELSEEVTKLQKMLHSRMDGNTDNEEHSIPGFGEVLGDAGKSSKRKYANKRKRHSGSEAGNMDMPSSSHEHNEVPRESAKDVHNEALPKESLVVSVKPQCCRNFEGSGGSVTGTSNCMFQELAESVLGLKFSVVDKTEEICIAAVHQSSGYSFTLTWVNIAKREEPEVLYRVLSLGTFERVAPEWMTDELMFSPTMCPIFFERVSRVVKLSS